MVVYGQLVVGPPGAGKTTYCHGMGMFARAIGRDARVVNLDFANDVLPYTADIDVRDLICLQDVMDEHLLGPNGGLVFCMEYLLENIDWLISRIRGLNTKYLIFDCPGQVELFTHYKCVEEILECLKILDIRLCSVHLVDSFYCSQPSTFISAVTVVASTMLRLGLPHVNVLTKADLLPSYAASMPFQLDFFTEMLDLTPLARFVDAPFLSHQELSEQETLSPSSQDPLGDIQEEDDVGVVGKVSVKREGYRKMTEALCDVLTDFGLVSFLPLNIQDAEVRASEFRVFCDQPLRSQVQ